MSRVRLEALTKRRAGGVSITEVIGNTPLIEMRHLGKDSKIKIAAKAEWFNPGGSVKDRAALYMLRDGEQKGELHKGKIILDSTSGNTGIAYAYLGAALGYRVELVVPGNVSREKKKILQAYGAKLTFSDPLEGSDGARILAQKLYQENSDRYFMPDQYSNPANPQAHYETTGKEILLQTEGKITHFVAGIGTSGTLIGTGRRLKEHNEAIQVIGMEPAEAMHGLEGLKNLSVSMVPSIFEASLLDRRMTVTTEEGYSMCDELAKREGLLVGFSSGAAMAAALKIAEELETGFVVTVFPDSGDRYLADKLIFQNGK